MTTLHSANTVIKCTDLGKCYQIYDSPKARLKQALWRGKKQYYKEFWALKNINFTVKRGESLGIIGRNGSGKSTLLQLICGTLTPTVGTVHAQGRIAALLELGSGFNPEFSGLENVYLNASMLGLSNEEIYAKLDDILGFADIGEFIHQPVKTYSSGMSVRLAFAVIANVNADILVIDEALAVGDAVFTQRCMRFIRKVEEEKCLLFVSHDANAVKSLCSHALWLLKGSKQSYGKCKTVTLDYLRYCTATSYGEETELIAVGEETSTAKVQDDQSLYCEDSFQADNCYDYCTETISLDNLPNANGWKTGQADLIEVSIRSIDAKNNDDNILKGGEQVEVVIRAKANKAIKSPALGFILKNRLGQDLFGENTLITRKNDTVISAMAGDELKAVFKLVFPMLPSGEYTLTASIADGDSNSNTQHHWLEDAVLLTVLTSKVRHGLVGAFINDVKLTIKAGP
ncbi:ABC-type lipopolysaccharide transport system/ ATPase component [Synechococcus sp. SYN20]|uniref:ABC transporter ATP-binding protein n=1 Tax=Synechococcus sp. SYN20 TaxID=1050714 RepID=UPI001647AEDB|nr:ABC transporter ATP-binding protein [Synechococcus sp. SYN20]QNJ24463.1 ABC-type lipopolysaccharide transport system/ ATPase component [Synechococcus sp. SYN20]